MALHIKEKEGTIGNSDHGTTYMREGGDDGKLRPWLYIYVYIIESKRDLDRRKVLLGLAIHGLVQVRQVRLREERGFFIDNVLVRIHRQRTGPIPPSH